MIETTLASFSAQFTLVDWGVVVGYLAFTTFLGAETSRQAGQRKGFLPRRSKTALVRGKRFDHRYRNQRGDFHQCAVRCF